MRAVLVGVLMLTIGACSAADTDLARDTDSAPILRRELTREEALAAARRLVAESRVDSLIYLDSVAVSLEPAVWRVAFKRRWMEAPFRMTIDVDRRTGEARFLGDG